MSEFQSNEKLLGSYSPQPPFSSSKNIGPILEIALQKTPSLYVQAGNLQTAVNRYRYEFHSIAKYVVQFSVLSNILHLIISTLLRYRQILSAVEATATQTIRLTLTRQLAELILRGVTGALYLPPESNYDQAGMMLLIKSWQIE